jgi:hypothetical protein
MVFGHNTNFRFGNFTFHIQTEDRGEAHALIDTTVYYHGRVLHRRTNNYFDLLPMNEDREEALRLRVDEQHRNVIEEIRSGALQLAIPAETTGPRAAAAPQPAKIAIELRNAKSWLSGKHARLQIVVRQENGTPVTGAEVRVVFEGSEGGEVIQGRTNGEGGALLEFELPRIVSAEATMMISAQNGSAKAHLRYALRAKPRVVTG